jgi:hypothetical protein
MAEGVTAPGSAPSRRQLHVWPQSALGWWAIALTALIFPAAWVLMTHAIPWPVLDTWVAPVSMTVLIDMAAVVGLVAVLRVKERAVLVFVALLIAVPLALFATVFLGLHAVAPD